MVHRQEGVARNGPAIFATPAFLLARVAIGGLVAALVGLQASAEYAAPSLEVALTLLGWLAASSALAALWRAARGWPRAVLALLLAGDTLAIALAIRTPGGIVGPALLLLAVPILAGGLLLQWRVGLLLGLFAAGAYHFLGLDGQGGTWSGVWPGGAHAAAALSAIGLASGVLGTRLASSLREVAETRSELAAVRLSTERIVESLGCALIAVDAHGRLSRLNREARTLLGLDDTQLDLTQSLSGPNAPLALMLSAELRGPSREREGEVRLQAPSGRPFPAWVKVAPIVAADGECHGLVALVWDLTDRKRLERAARRSARLAAIGELAAGLAHEIRNSVKPITGCVELLSQRELLPAKARPMVEVMTREAESLEAFLSQFLTLCRDKTLKLEPLDLEELIGQEVRALEMAGSGAPGRVQVSAGEGGRLIGDREWLRQVFRNLVLNGLEANPQGKVRVEFTKLSRRGRPWVLVRISDEGPGFSPDDARRAFKPFWTRKMTGTGLGLPIALRGVREHGGRMRLGPGEGVGAAVTVELPADGPSRAHSARGGIAA